MPTGCEGYDAHYNQHLRQIFDLVEEARREQRERESCGSRSRISDRDLVLPGMVGDQVLL